MMLFHQSMKISTSARVSHPKSVQTWSLTYVPWIGWNAKYSKWAVVKASLRATLRQRVSTTSVALIAVIILSRLRKAKILTKTWKEWSSVNQTMRSNQNIKINSTSSSYQALSITMATIEKSLWICYIALKLVASPSLRQNSTISSKTYMIVR